MINREINLLSSLPRTKRDIKYRLTEKSDEVINIARRFDKEYFDGDRKYGYGGYHCDGRWRSVAKDIIKHFKLEDGARILDVGCAKGFLLYELMQENPTFYLKGLDISRYAIRNAHPEIKSRLSQGRAQALPFRNSSFDLVISINTIHNLSRKQTILALKNIERVSRGKSYVVVDSYQTPEQKKQFQHWCLTAQTHGYPWEWKRIFEEAGYTGAYSWNML